MKPLVWILVFILLLCACSGGNTPDVSETPTQATFPSQTPLDAQPSLRATIPLVTEETDIAEALKSTFTPTATTRPTRTPFPTITPTPTRPTPTTSLTPTATPLPGPLALTVNNAQNITQLAWWGTGVPNTTAWSQDGTLLAVGSSLGVYLYDAHTFEQVRFIYTGENVRVLAISPDGQRLATGSERVSLWEISTGESLGILEGSVEGWITYLAFSPGGMWLAALGADSFVGPLPGRILVWDTDSFQILYVKEFDYLSMPQNFAFSHDGRMIAFNQGGRVSLMTVSTGEEVAILRLGSQIYSNIVFSSDDTHLISSISASRIGFIDIVTHRTDSFIMVEDAHKIALTPDGKTLAVHYDEWSLYKRVSSVQLWDIETGQLRITLDNVGPYEASSFNPDGLELATITETDVQIWSLETGMLVNTIPYEPEMNSIAFGYLRLHNQASKMFLVAGNKQGEVSLFDPELGQLIQSIKVSDLSILALAIHPDGQVLAVMVENNGYAEILLYDLKTDKLLKTIRVYNELYSYMFNLSSLAFSIDGKAVAARTRLDMQITGWEIQSGEKLLFPDKKTWFNAGYFGAGSDGHLIGLKYISIENDLITYDIHDDNTGEVLAVSLSMPASFICERFINYTISLDSRYLALGCNSNGIPILDLSLQKEAYILEGHRIVYGDIWWVNVTDLSFSPYGYLLVSSGFDETIRFWNVSTGNLLLTLSDHTDWVTDVAFSPDGRYLASSSADGTLRLWGLQP